MIKILSRQTKKKVDFFDLFVESTESAHQAAIKLEALVFSSSLTNFKNCDEQKQAINKQIKAIEEIEHECDQHVHKILAQLNKSFVTPIDREDIYLLAKELDNITDAIESTAHRLRMLNVTIIREEAKELAKLIVECTKELKVVMVELKHMHKKSSLSSLREKIIMVNDIENKGDNIFRDAITQLFCSEDNTNKDPIEVIKWKEIFEYLENTLDACEDVANIVEGVIMKHV